MSVSAPDDVGLPEDLDALAAPGPARGRLRVRHTTRFGYQPPLSASFNECRVSPVSDARQHVLQAAVHIEPCTWRHAYTDYWGTSVVAFEVLAQHAGLTVESNLLAEVRAAGEVPRTSWELLAAPAVADRFTETLAQTVRSDPGEELTALALDVVARSGAPHEAARAVCRLVTAEVAYRPGITGVNSAAADAWQARSGVCQDLAHLAAGALRAVGIPTRYVSGYLHPSPDAALGETVAGEGHAWVEWWTGAWFGWDPTNDVPVGTDHVTVGRGRDYGDVPPLQGVVAGGGASGLDVEVAVTRVS